METEDYEEIHKEISRLISVNLDRLRNLRKMTRLDLACKAELSAAFIYEIEKCKRNVSPGTLGKLARALQAQPYQLLLPEHIADDGVTAFIRDFNDCVLYKMDQIAREYLPQDHDPWGLNKPRKKKEDDNPQK